MDGDFTLTVGELIDELNKYPSNWKLSSEGCDCWGAVAGVLEVSEGELLLYRDKREVGHGG